MYAGNIFKTQSFQDNKSTKTDDSHVRYEYINSENENETTYGTIIRIFKHTLPSLPGPTLFGPSLIIIEGEWYRTYGKHDISGNIVLRDDLRHPFNTHSKFVFLHNCYQQPVAFFPYDPFNERGSHVRKFREVIDLNQDQISQDGVF